MWKVLKEGSSVLPTLKQITPSERSSVSGNEGVGDRSEIGKTPESGQGKIWGNLNKQSRGMEGKLDTQGKSEPELFTDKKGATKTTVPGTYTPSKYKEMYKTKIHESANAEETGAQSGKHKVSAAANSSDPTIKNVEGADTQHGGSCNCGAPKPKKSCVTESQVIGSTLALVSAHALAEGFNLAPFMKRG